VVGRATEAILGADDFSAEQAERYGWINGALPDADLDAFVAGWRSASRRPPPTRCDLPSACSTS
jgi:enoyl-CoA hydratase/carnithine racemase